MKVYISITGTLRIEPENTTESYAMQAWVNSSVKFISGRDSIELKMGDLCLTSSNGSDCIDNLEKELNEN